MRPLSILLIMPVILWVAISRSILSCTWNDDSKYTLKTRTAHQFQQFKTYNSNMHLQRTIALRTYFYSLYWKNIYTRKFRSFPIIEQTRTNLSRDAQEPVVCEQLEVPFAISQTTQSSCRCVSLLATHLSESIRLQLLQLSSWDYLLLSYNTSPFSKESYQLVLLNFNCSVMAGKSLSHKPKSC